MTANKLEKILIKYDKNCIKNWQEVVNAVNEYIEEHPGRTFDGTFPDGQIDRMLDSISTRPCWIKDRMNGNKKITTKVRKALGYLG